MKVVGAAQLRQSLRKLARSLEKDGEPIMLQVGRRQVGVLVSVKDFRERFALRQAAEERTRLVQEILQDRRRGEVPVEEALADLRGR